VGDQVQSGKFLKDSNRVRRAENGHGTSKANVFCARSRCTKNDDWGGVNELTTVVFADAENIQTNLIGEHNLLN
jgi:hypothetical protein